MYDKELILELLRNIRWAIDQIQSRSAKISSYEEFLEDNSGREILDSICMQFINIGEALKKVDRLTSEEVLAKYPDVDWKAAMGMRDVITHHYFDIDAEVVYRTIQNQLPELRKVIEVIISDLE